MQKPSIFCGCGGCTPRLPPLSPGIFSSYLSLLKPFIFPNVSVFRQKLNIVSTNSLRVFYGHYTKIDRRTHNPNCFVTHQPMRNPPSNTSVRKLRTHFICTRIFIPLLIFRRPPKRVKLIEKKKRERKGRRVLHVIRPIVQLNIQNTNVIIN